MHTNDDEQLKIAWGESLSRSRIAAEMSQAELATRTGLRIPTIWRIENGKRYPSESVKRKLAGALRRSIGELFPYAPTPPPEPQPMEAA